MAQLYTLDKRSLFSYVRGEINLKLYLSTKEDFKQVISSDRSGGGGVMVSGGAASKKNKKMQQQGGNLIVPQQMGQERNKMGLGLQNLIHPMPVEPSLGDIKPVVISTIPGPVIPAAAGGAHGVGISHGAGIRGYSTGLSEFALKETNPHIGGLNKDKTSSTYDLVEQMQYLYVKVVRAREISLFGGGELVAEVKLGNYKGITNRVSLTNADWDQIFAFSKDCFQSSTVDIFVKESGKDEYLGRVSFDLVEVPKRVPPDSQLAPQWYRMEDKKGDKAKCGEVMVSMWFGTQADEAFSEAWHSKAANVHFDGLNSIKSKVYLSPKLWYLRVSVMEAQDIFLGGKGAPLNKMVRYPELFAKVLVGNQVLRTGIASAMTNRSFSNPCWNEDFMFVVAEPFEDYLLISVEDRQASNRDEVVGRLVLPMTNIESRFDDKPVMSRWFNLDTQFSSQNESKAVVRFASRIHLRASLEGGYHVLDQATMYSSDVRPTAKQLWKPHIGVLEVGLLGATNLMPTKIKDGKGGLTDAYCVAKYGQKWVRTRTVVDSLAPKWNEQYTWEVYDPCTVISIGVFDNSRVDKNTASGAGNRDTCIGKVRIRLSTLESDRVYTHAYPLLMLHPSGVKKMGELSLAVRFSCANMFNMLHSYTLPLLPKMHYVQPLSVNQLDCLRCQAMSVIASRLSRAEPPLGREVVEYMLDHDSHMWSMRKSKANFFRLTNVLAWFVVMSRLLESLRNWHKPVYSTLFLIVFIILVLVPELIIPCIFLKLATVGIWRYRSRPCYPPHMDTRLSFAETILPDELDEEFDSFPTSRSAEIVRMRYDRLRSIAGRIQTVVGDFATQGERFQALLSWRDPRATFLFVMFCFIAAFGFYLVPIRWVVAVWVVYYLRPPRFRNKLPSCAVNFFKRLPTNADTML
ncbi:FT-interacting 1 [Olea europaea subsp. europaea]|uniref:FT-interacting 1 n=1 Tax=Olea europaea subsp. europaea TaxID=158383 RepID=A0A8S0TGR7_OLEEU|nr:FT-interacting 1 [Olea europaea subsp. europaea]